MIETFKIIHGIYDTEVVPQLRLLSELRGTDKLRGKHSLGLYQTRARLELKKNSFTHRVVKVWNSLPEDVVTASTVNEFKNKLDKAWETNEAKYNYRKGVMGEENDNV